MPRRRASPRNVSASNQSLARWLPKCITGEHILAVAITEPGAGSDVAGIRTRAEDKGDHFLLNGSKTYISNGINADLVVVVARTDMESRHGLSLFVVERGMAAALRFVFRSVRGRRG